MAEISAESRCGMLTQGTRRCALGRIGLSVAALALLGVFNGAGARAGPAAGEQTPTVVLRVNVQGAQGSVLSIPRGIDCERFCEARFRQGAHVMLVAGSSPTSRFAGWTGGCVGRSVYCLVVADRTKRVSARFVAAPGQDVGGAVQTKYWLYVTTSGNGSVSSSPAGISCPSRCEKSFQKGAGVTLRADPAAGYMASWQSLSASCGGELCQARMDANAYVSVAFVKARR